MIAMSSAVPLGPRDLSPFEQLRLARDIVRHEGDSLVRLARQLDDSFCAAVDLIASCPGNVLVCGMGKAGLIGQKIAATLASTGTRAFFLHPAEALHGDLGRVCAADVALVLSQSGETAEVLQVLPAFEAAGASVVAITCRGQSSLARQATATICLGAIDEAGPLALAPTATTTAMLAVGDALALVVSEMRGFCREDFARNHPGGSLGRHLMRVEQAMRPLAECRVARDAETARNVFIERRRAGRRSGAIMLVDEAGVLSGIFTDSDLARLFERARESELDGPMARLMTRHPKRIVAGAMLADAVHLMANSKISELPVVDAAGIPLGMLDVTDLVPLLPDDALRSDAASGEPAPDNSAMHVGANGAIDGPAKFAPPASASRESENRAPPTLPFLNRDGGRRRT
jgi:arabinose-5-phosphate isomerase